MRRSLVVSGAMLLVCSSCSLFTSFGELSGDGDGPTADGGGSGEGGTTTTDAADGGGGGSDAGEGGGGRFCATVDASLCDDFDDPADTALLKWSVKVDVPQGTVTREPSGFSAPNAVSCKAVGSGNDQISAYLEKTYAAAKRTRFHYRFRVEESEATGFLQIGQLQVDTMGNSRTAMRLTIGGGTAHFEGAVYPSIGGSGTFPNVTQNFTLETMKWHEVEMAVDWEAVPARVTIDYDGMRMADNAAITGSNFGPGKLLVAAGIYYLEGGDSPWRIVVDDVVIGVE